MAAQCLPVSTSSWQVLGLGEELSLASPSAPHVLLPQGHLKPSECRDALGQVPSGVSGMDEAARARSGWGQPGDREGRNVPRRCKSALVPQHELGTELGHSSERGTEQGSGEGALKTSQRTSS